MFIKWSPSCCWPNCFVIKNTNYVWYRLLWYHCNDCDACFYTLGKCSAVCGAYASHTWMKPVVFINVLIRSNDNNLCHGKKQRDHLKFLTSFPEVNLSQSTKKSFSGDFFPSSTFLRQPILAWTRFKSLTNCLYPHGLPFVFSASVLGLVLTLVEKGQNDSMILLSFKDSETSKHLNSSFV